MAIQVLCSNCKTRFKVSEKFAGQKGPCPKCKAVITIPQPTEEVVIHAPEHSEAGAKDAGGKLILKPIEREETEFQPLVAVVAGAIAMLSLLVAFVLRGSESVSTVVLAAGALLIAPPVCWAGYQVLRDDEQLESFTGTSLWIRTAICSVLYAALWGLFSFFYYLFFGTNPAEVTSIFFMGGPFLLMGAGVAYCCYDFDFGSGFFHYCFYLLVTILLRLVMGLPPVGPAGGG